MLFVGDRVCSSRHCHSWRGAVVPVQHSLRRESVVDAETTKQFASENQKNTFNRQRLYGV